MNLVEHVKKICLAPDTEWPVIAGEDEPAGALVTGSVVPLAALTAAAGSAMDLGKLEAMAGETGVRP